jgi:osmotically-inducible protein OsmY
MPCVCNVLLALSIRYCPCNLLLPFSSACGLLPHTSNVRFPNSIYVFTARRNLQTMRRRITGFIALAALSVLLPGCDNTANSNANYNSNATANANATATATPVVANNNTNTNRAPTREEYERDKERYNREAKESGRTVGTGINDGWLWVKTRFDLAAADDLRDSTINVDVDKAVVTLTGTVASAAQKTKAEQVAKAVDGVTSVKNMLKVQAANANANHNANANANANAKRGGTNR